MEPLIFLGGIAVGVGVLMVAFHFQDERRAREDQRRVHNFHKHIRAMDADSHRYLRSDDRRPE